MEITVVYSRFTAVICKTLRRLPCYFTGMKKWYLTKGSFTTINSLHDSSTFGICKLCHCCGNRHRFRRALYLKDFALLT